MPVTSNVMTAFSFRNLLDCINIATSATTAYQLFDLVKVIQIEAWTLGIAGGGGIQVAFLGSSAFPGDGKIYTDTQVGVSPAHVKCRPPKTALAANFQLSGTAWAFQVASSAAGYIDVECEFRMSNEVAPTAVQNAPVGATQGQVYYRSLDGNASGAWIPQGWPFID